MFCHLDSQKLHLVLLKLAIHDLARQVHARVTLHGLLLGFMFIFRFEQGLMAIMSSSVIGGQLYHS